MEAAHRREAELWATWTALTGEPLTGDAAALVAAEPSVAAAIEPRFDVRARTIDADLEGRPCALFATIDRPFERWHLAALLNWRERPALCALPLDRCGLVPGDEWLAFDFWGRASLGIATHAVGRRLPARSCLLVALRQNVNRPQVAGSTRHYSVGGVELADVTWDAATSTLAGQAAPDANGFSLMIRSPHPFVPRDAAGGEVGPLAEARTSLALPPSDRWRPWSIAFEHATNQPTRFPFDLPLRERSHGS